MTTLIALIGPALIAYVVYLISSIGVAIMAFFGLIFMLLTVYMWFHQMQQNLFAIKVSLESNTDYILHEIKRSAR